jgi:SAM-dependent methyltransferase
MLCFRCNICGGKTSYPRNLFSRERWSCVYCGSNIRWRSIIHALSLELFGKSKPLCDFPLMKDIRGVGMSDWEGYANLLEEKFNYTNTYYHQEPLLDITNINDSQYAQYDFIIASDVFEHVCPPVSIAFENAGRLLKPGGLLILTVPYFEGDTVEHFPGTRAFSVFQRNGQWILLSESADGTSKEFTDLIFHGGPGTTVEFRRFGKRSLAQNCRDAGLELIHIHGKESEEFGILWNENEYISSVPWAVVNGGKLKD